MRRARSRKNDQDRATLLFYDYSDQKDLLEENMSLAETSCISQNNKELLARGISGIVLKSKINSY